jgi:hypothetical protein
LRHSYEKFSERGIKVLQEWADGIDRDRLEVRLSSGATMGYDRLIVAPGIYERVSMAAWLLAATNPTAKIIVLDPKDEFTKKDLFLDSWKRHYPDMIEWTPLSKLGKVEVDPKAMEFRAGGETFKADVANVIPTQKAGAVAEGAGPTMTGARWFRQQCNRA